MLPADRASGAGKYLFPPHVFDLVHARDIIQRNGRVMAAAADYVDLVHDENRRRTYAALKNNKPRRINWGTPLSWLCSERPSLPATVGNPSFATPSLKASCANFRDLHSDQPNCCFRPRLTFVHAAANDWSEPNWTYAALPRLVTLGTLRSRYEPENTCAGCS